MYPMEQQKMYLWCWAAVARSVHKFFEPSSQLKQCAIASLVNPMGINCCMGANMEDCNQVANLDEALDKVHHFHDVVQRSVSFDAIRVSIDAGFPVCARIQWWGGSGHFVVITGYTVDALGEPFVTVADPQNESGCWSYDDFSFRYFGIGSWSHTYRVKR